MTDGRLRPVNPMVVSSSLTPEPVSAMQWDLLWRLPDGSSPLELASRGKSASATTVWNFAFMLMNRLGCRPYLGRVGSPESREPGRCGRPAAPIGW